MNEEIMVSVISFAYNHGKYIKEALDSIINQKTNFRFELIVNDDASTDNTTEIINEYYSRYPDIIVPIIHESNNYQKGINVFPSILKSSRGKYIAFCECDDFWSDEYKLQKQFDILTNNPDYSMCVHNTMLMNYIDNTQKLLNEYEKEDCIMDTSRILEWEDKPSFHTSSFFYRKECLNELPSYYYNAKGFGDLPLALLLSTKGDIYYINECMSNYRMLTNNSWSTKFDNDYIFRYEHKINLIKMFILFDEETKKKYHSQVHEIIRLQRLMAIDIKKKYKYKFTCLDYLRWFFGHVYNKFLKMIRSL